jgi:hypothetical protein
MRRYTVCLLVRSVFCCTSIHNFVFFLFHPSLAPDFCFSVAMFRLLHLASLGAASLFAGVCLGLAAYVLSIGGDSAIFYVFVLATSVLTLLVLLSLCVF